MRIILTGAVLCAFASTAFAAEHYVEVWNPPEARIGGTHPTTSGKKAHSKKTAKRRSMLADHVTPRKVAEPALRESAPIAAPSVPATNRHPLIAPKIGPDGHIMQVSYRAPGRRASSATRIQ